MQHIGPDMDDLFRKAAENYSLKQGIDRWEEIASKLDNNSQPLKKPKKKGYKKYLAMFLFLLAFLFLFDFFLRNTKDDKSIQQNSELNKSNNTIDKITNTAKEKLDEVTASDKSNPDINLDILSRSSGVQQEQTNWKGENTNEQATLPDIDLLIVAAADNTIAKMISNREPIDADHPSNFHPLTIQAGSRIAVNIPSLTPTKEVKKTATTIYYGLIAGTGFTSINSQQVNKAGFEFGLTGGLRISDRFSVETGVLFSDKYYQTSGKYFSMKNMGSMPAGMTIMGVEGRSNLLQVPLHIRYNILNKSDHRFYTSAGFSTFVLTKENNSYHMMMNGSESMMYSTYKNRHSYFAGSFDISIGYEKDIGAKTNLRIGPYLQLPIKGIGVGELQLKSTGLRIALTRSSR